MGKFRNSVFKGLAFISVSCLFVLCLFANEAFRDYSTRKRKDWQKLEVECCSKKYWEVTSSYYRKNTAAAKGSVRGATLSDDEKNKPNCDISRLNLNGSSNTSAVEILIANPPSLDTTSLSNSNLSDGGRFAPGHCVAKFKVAIIIPFRDRELQLRGLLAHMHPIWQRQGIDYTVYVITQNGTGVFNKGKLMNAGFKEASKERTYDCFVFHDVDLLLENDGCLYWCPKEEHKVMHMPVYIDKFDYRLLKYRLQCPILNFPFTTIKCFGGVTVFTAKQFLDVNGFSNMFWGWGGEDDDASLRVKTRGYSVIHNAMCQYKMFKHGRDTGNKENLMASRMLSTAYERRIIDGLNSLRYTMISISKTPLYTNVTIDVGEPSRRMIALLNETSAAKGDKCNGKPFLKSDVW